jgi:hypothetical protein
MRRQPGTRKTEWRHRGIEQLILIELQRVAISGEHRECRRIGERAPIRSSG